MQPDHDDSGSITRVCTPTPPEPLDILHLPVTDDPLKWSRKKKYATMFCICFASLASALSASIALPFINQLQSELHTNDQIINLTVSLFILFQGCLPLLWSAISEIKGRKLVYLVSMSIFTLANIGQALANSGPLYLAMRIIQACGSASVLAIGAGSLADIFEPRERGTIIGIYYLFPLIGPSAGSLLGGLFSQTSSFRSAFWFLTAYGASVVVTFIFFPDTFRKERSLAYIEAIRRAEAHAKIKEENARRARDKAMEGGAKFDEDRPDKMVLKTFKGGQKLGKIVTPSGEEVPITIRFNDISIFRAVFQVLRAPNNILTIVSSGVLFAASYSLSFTAAISFAQPPYNYGPLKIGLVLLSFGLGNIVGSIGGGRYSDILLRRSMKAGSKSPEIRIRATLPALAFLPTSYIAYAWLLNFHQHIATLVVMLFLQGVSTVWIYSAVLTYIVDSNAGQSSSAVACNSTARGTLAFVASEIARPLLKAIGNGWLYTLWAFILLLAEVALVLVLYKGKAWREKYTPTTLRVSEKTAS